MLVPAGGFVQHCVFIVLVLGRKSAGVESLCAVIFHCLRLVGKKCCGGSGGVAPSVEVVCRTQCAFCM